MYSKDKERESEALLPKTHGNTSKSLHSDATSQDGGYETHLARQPNKYKIIALLCAIFMAVGSHFAAHTLGAMKNTIKTEFGISNAQYGAIQSSVSIVNTILPALGGIFLDTFGTLTGSIITTGLIAVGNILVAISTSNKSLATMIAGRVLYGVGSGTVVIVQETILSQWFNGSSLAAVVALMMTVSRLASFSAQASVVPIANRFGWYGYGFWFCAFLCIVSVVINLVYLLLIRNLPSTDESRYRYIALKRKRSFSWDKLLYLPHSYWLIVSMEFLLGGAWGCFLHINSEMIKMRFGYDNAHAAAIGSTAQILPIILMPILGVCVDRFGRRTWMMLGSSITFLISIVLIGYTYLMPLLSMLFFSVSLALGPVGLVSSVPVILPLSLVGTGMGLIKSGTNIGASLFDIATGLLQDADPAKGYGGVVDFFIGIGVLAVLAGLTLCVIDRTLYRSLLDKNARESLQYSQEEWVKTDGDKLNRKMWANWIYGGVFLALAALSWGLFIRFVLLL
ncbi:major facilitator superfamily domain-containing protein [Dichotomocladium elegans]|nr:major facilitator superfamily domain-containing protein [Dichotomocladium elegans]